MKAGRRSVSQSPSRPYRKIDKRKIDIYGEACGSLGGGGACIRQSMNFHTASTVTITTTVAIQRRTIIPRACRCARPD